MLSLVGEITATAENVRLVVEATTAEVVFDGDVINTAGGSIEGDELEAEVTEIEAAVLEEDVVIEEVAVLE